MKTKPGPMSKNVIRLFVGALFTVIMTACFSPYTGDSGNLVIQFGDSGGARAAYETYTHTITVAGGPGKTHTRTNVKQGDRISFSVEPGAWNVDVLAYDGQNAAAYALTSGVEVAAGKSTGVKLAMLPAVSRARETGFYKTVTVCGVEIYEPIPASIVPANNLDKAVQHVNSNPASYLMLLDEGESAAPYGYTLNAGALTLEGRGEGRTISLAGEVDQGVSIFTVEGTAALTLGTNITLNGANMTNTPIVVINAGGNLIMKDNALITGNRNTVPQFNGGGVNMTGGSFLMEGGIIEGNHAWIGGGVYMSDGTFTMTGGEISNNEAHSSDDNVNGGAGVFVAGGTFSLSGTGKISENRDLDNYGHGGGIRIRTGGSFTMKGGEISYNSSVWGGGIYAEDIPNASGKTFTMEGGIINDNNGDFGGGVCVGNYSTFEMTGGTITDNTSIKGGAGVIVSCDVGEAVFTMNGGNITANNANISGDSNPGSGKGGGVYINSGEFKMMGGQIFGNNAAIAGGGVCLLPNQQIGFFTMSGGAIYDNEAADMGGGVFVDTERETGDQDPVVSVFTKTNGVISGPGDPNYEGNTVSPGAANKGAVAYVAAVNPDDIRYRETTVGDAEPLSSAGGDVDGWLR